jgi:hypothetical protein
MASRLETLHKTAAEDFVELRDFAELPDGAGVEQNSKSWTSRFLSLLANPYKPALAVRRSVHHAREDTFDILRHEYTVANRACG